MKASIALPIATIMVLGAVGAALAGDLKDRIRVEMQSTELHEGMEPGTYVCAAGHLHIKGTVQNLADVSVGSVKVAGKVFDADGKLLGTAATSTKPFVLNPSEKTAIDLEFLTITGPLVKQVKHEELSVVAVAPRP